MSNILGDDSINVTCLIKKHGYKPVYKNGFITKLINPNPEGLSSFDCDKITNKIYLLLDSDSISEKITNKHILENYRYQYTYFITYTPVDVYYVEFIISMKRISFYIRKENDRIIYPEKDGLWKIKIN